MSKAIRRGLILVVSWALFSAAAMAKTSVNNADNHKHKAGVHHSRFSKLAFWRHHKDGEKNVKSAQTNHPQPKHTPVKAAQRKTVSSTVAAGKKNRQQNQHPGNKAPAGKASSASKTKPEEKAQDHTTAALKQ